VEARALRALVAEALERAWRRDSPVHGETHWRCVAASGLALAAATPGADTVVCLCFGLLHDMRRENESFDPGHGPRAAELARSLAADGRLALGEARTALLAAALALHADGMTSADPTTGACWDADRVHLPRVGIVPRADLLSTEAGRRPESVAAAAELRASAPSWDALVAAAVH
jgi:uncharacterized protein